MSTGAVGGEGGASLHGGSIQGASEAHGASATGATPSGNDPTSVTTLNSMLQQFAGAVNAAAYGAEENQEVFDASSTSSEQEFQPVDAVGEDGGSGKGGSQDSREDSGSSSTSTGGYNFSQAQEGTSAAMSELEAKTLQASYAGAAAAQEVEVAGVANQKDSGIAGYNADMNAATDTMNQAKFDLSASMVQAGFQAGGAAMSFGMTVQGESAAMGSQKDLNSYSNTQKAIATPRPETTVSSPAGGSIKSGPNGTEVITKDDVPVSTDKQQFTVNGKEAPNPGDSETINSSTFSTSGDGDSISIENNGTTTTLNKDGTVMINGKPASLAEGGVHSSTGYNPAISNKPLSSNEVAHPDPNADPAQYTTNDRQQLVRTGKLDDDPTGAKTQSIINDLKAGEFDDTIGSIDARSSQGSTAAIEQSAAARNQYSAWAGLCNAAFSSVATMASAPLTYEGAVQQKEAQIQSAESHLDSSSAQMSSSEISTANSILGSVQTLVSSALSALSSTLTQNQ